MKNLELEVARALTDLANSVNIAPLQQDLQNHKCGKTCAPHVGCKARPNFNLLTEDQKEARRFRRMLANRESARQTILRRQARCEELARKAAELECENANLKKEKEVAMKNYESLKSTNESLKAQLNLNGVTVNVEAKETKEGSKFDNAHITTSTSTRTQQIYVYNQPSGFPYITPEHENPVRMNVPGSPFAPPYAWLFPLSYYANGVPPQSSDLANKYNITNESSTSSFRKPVADVKNDHRYPLKMIRGEASTSTEIIGPSVQVYCGKASGEKLAHKHKVTSAAVTDSSLEGNEATVIGLNVRQKDAIKRSNEFITSAATTSGSSEENEERTDGSLLRRQMDAFTAAEARKRRMEIIKIKNFHYSRQSHVKISSI